ncbi:MAG: hypothetical protein HY666_06560 [Chloroflexi bacterium]|nr:hypothetical protein [Chloroflexota bacterium]
MAYGLTIKQDTGGKRLEMQCQHQNGLLYIVPSEASWVCPQEHLHAHALVGFLKELVDLKDERVKALMARWGIYFRERPLISQAEGDS